MMIWENIILAEQDYHEYLKLLNKPDNPIYLSVFILILITAVVYIFFKYVLFPKERFYQQEIIKRSLESMENERQRIAVELHDSLGQNLSVLKLKLSMHNNNGNIIIDKKDSQLIFDCLTKSFEEIRNISYNLKPKILESSGFIPAVVDLCRNITEKTPLKVITDIKGEEVELPEQMEINLYRIVQEALSNVIKHANTGTCTLQIEFNPGKVKMLISDKGAGFDVGKFDYFRGKSFGLSNIKQRVEILNGVYKINSKPGQGTNIFIEIPIENSAIANNKENNNR